MKNSSEQTTLPNWSMEIAISLKYWYKDTLLLVIKAPATLTMIEGTKRLRKINSAINTNKRPTLILKIIFILIKFC